MDSTISPGNTSRGGAALIEAVRKLYDAGQTDYAMEPIILTDAQGRPVGRIGEGDAVIFCCRRGEREIQLTEVFTEPGFEHFSRPLIKDLIFVILTLYHEKFKDLPVAFAPSQIKDTLGEVVSRSGLRQWRISESEKFAHVTFFLSGGNNQPFKNETDVRVPSPKGIPYDQVPQLSLPQVTDEVIRALGEGVELIVVNFANGDVIGHSSNRAAKIQCAREVDGHLGKVIQAALVLDYVIMVTADHGNLEEMVLPDGTDHVSHTANPVPFLLLDGHSSKPAALRDGRLADVAPTILQALGVAVPDAMDSISLAPEHNWSGARRVLLVILDGWGTGKQDENNPIHVAETPVWDDLVRRCPPAQLQAAGEAVGLKAGKAGNSEAGHMNIGAGRVVPQDDMRLDLAMKDGSFYTNPIFIKAIEQVRQRGTNLHLIGLLTEKSSHGSIDYPLALLKMAKENGVDRVFLHLILDGRSTEPGSAPALLAMLEQRMAEVGAGKMVSAVGRGIALDRDGNYPKTQRAYEALVFGKGHPAPEGEPHA